jgi:hypothetical protein
MEVLRIHQCAICGEPRLGNEPWFLIAENRWEDKLKILQWNDQLATQGGMRCACSPCHVEELVVHWMTTGSVNHPFAQRPREHRFPQPHIPEPDNPGALPTGARQILELSIDRSTVKRTLNERPQSLNTILHALVIALQRDIAGTDAVFLPEEESLCAV